MMPKEWEAIASDGEWTKNIVERCYALHCKPPRELTDAEIDKLWVELAPESSHKKVLKKFADAILAAHQRKQQEPETVKFRAARVIGDEASIAVLRADMLPCGWEWLPGEPQEIEVKV